MIKFPIDFDNHTHRDAARLAIQSAVASAAMFTLMKTVGMPERFVGVLSAVMVVQPSAGAAINEAQDRFMATILGAVIGFVCLLLLPNGYGTAAALALSMLVMNAIAGFREHWRYGVVAAVALALGSESNMWQTALDRSIAIGAGVVVGALVTLVIWPDKSEDRAQRSLCAAWDALAGYLEAAVGRTMGKETSGDDVAARYRDYMRDTRAALDNVKMAETDAIKADVETTESIWSAARFLERIGEEGDPADDGGMRDCVEKLSNAAGNVLRARAKGDSTPQDALDSMNAAVEQARAYNPPSDTGDELARAAHGALVFTMGELAEAVRRLADQRSGKGA